MTEKIVCQKCKDEDLKDYLKKCTFCGYLVCMGCLTEPFPMQNSVESGPDGELNIPCPSCKKRKLKNLT